MSIDIDEAIDLVIDALRGETDPNTVTDVRPALRRLGVLRDVLHAQHAELLTLRAQVRRADGQEW
jgi:hypothetical protein